MGRTYDLAIFDMDGTLTTNRSSWAYVHEWFGVDNEEAYRAFVNMEIDEREFMRRDIALWKTAKPDISRRDIIHIMRSLPLIDGIQETVAALQYAGIKCVICSGGIDIAAEMIVNEYGFDGYAADGLEIDEEGKLTGEGIIVVDLREKGVTTERLIEQYGSTKERTFAVGNSFTDISMFEACGMSIAFNPVDEYTEKAATHCVHSGNLSDILELVFVQVQDGV